MNEREPNRRPKRFAVSAIAAGVALVVGGALLARSPGVTRTVGLAMLGYGIGLLVAGAFLALGQDPLRRRQ